MRDKPNQERNREIYRLIKAREPRKSVARRFRISPGRVWQIVTAIDTEKAFQERRAIFWDRVRHADDLHRNWGTTDFVNALNLPSMARTALLNYFRWKGMKSVSIRDILDLLVPETAELNPLHWYSPAHGVRMLGNYGIGSILNELSECDLGPTCNAEYRKRLALYRSRFPE